jgi:hypothetical protein
MDTAFLIIELRENGKQNYIKVNDYQRLVRGESITAVTGDASE